MMTIQPQNHLTSIQILGT